jgi:hypothetical protein
VEIDADWAAGWSNQYGINDHFDDFDEGIDLICDRCSANAQ